MPKLTNLGPRFYVDSGLYENDQGGALRQPVKA